MDLVTKSVFVFLWVTLTSADTESSCTVPGPVICPIQAFDCPFNGDGDPEDGAFPDLDDPQRYYNCANGIAYAHLCPQGSVFVSEFATSNCTYQLCVEVQEKAEEVFTEPYDIDAKKTLQREVEKQRNKVKDEVLNLLIPKRNKRDSQKNQQCEGLSNLPWCKSSNVFTCYEDELGRPIDGTYAHPTQCSMYYHCKSNIAYPQVCPPNYAFSPQPRVRSCGYLICVPEDRGLCPVDGAWSEWSDWSSCSVSCGDGIRSRTRECDNPPPSNGGRRCPGSDLDLEECNASECTSGLPLVFFASYNGSGFYPDELDPVPFNNVHIDEEGCFDLDTSIFTIPRNGLFYVAFNVGLMARQRAQLTLMKNDTKIVNILRLHTTHDVTDTMARDYIGYFEKGDELRLASGINSGFDGSSFPEARLISWVILEHSYKENSTVFFAGRTRFGFLRTPVTYDNVVLNLGGAFDSAHFDVPNDGIYFISIGMGFHSLVTHHHLVCRQSCYNWYDIGFWNKNMHRAVDQHARSVLYDLKAGARIYMEGGFHKYSDAQMQIYYSAFKYSDINENKTVAFAAYHRNHVLGVTEDINPFIFDTVGLNQGNAYSNGTVTCTIPGYYMIHFSAGRANSQGNRFPVKLWLLKNGSEKVSGIIVNGVWGTDYDTRSKYAAVYLSEGETLNIMVEAGTGMRSHDKHIFFTGFLVR